MPTGLQECFRSWGQRHSLSHDHSPSSFPVPGAPVAGSAAPADSTAPSSPPAKHGPDLAFEPWQHRRGLRQRQRLHSGGRPVLLESAASSPATGHALTRSEPSAMGLCRCAEADAESITCLPRFQDASVDADGWIHDEPCLLWWLPTEWSGGFACGSSVSQLRCGTPRRAGGGAWPSSPG